MMTCRVGFSEPVVCLLLRGRHRQLLRSSLYYVCVVCEGGSPVQTVTNSLPIPPASVRARLMAAIDDVVLLCMGVCGAQAGCAIVDQKIGRKYAAAYPMTEEVLRAFAVRNLEYSKALKKASTTQ